MDPGRRTGGGMLAVGAVSALTVAGPLAATGDRPVEALAWISVAGVFMAASVAVWLRRPGHPAGSWFAVSAGAFGVAQALEELVARLGADPGAHHVVAALVAMRGVVVVLAAVAFAHLLGLFPEGRPRRRYERYVLRALWLALLVPPVAALSHSKVLVPSYLDLAEIPNPHRLGVMAPLGGATAAIAPAAPAVFIIGIVLVALRYRCSTEDQRRSIRWLLVPAILTALAAGADLLARAGSAHLDGSAVEAAIVVMWMMGLVALPATIAVGLLGPRFIDVDHVLRRSLVWGVLWLAIAGAYLGGATGLGLAAGRQLPVGTAIVLTVGATVVFQPARARLEHLANRWVFGARADPAELVADLGATLAGTLESDVVLPHIAETLRRGLDLRWARVTTTPAPNGACEHTAEYGGAAPTASQAGAACHSGEAPELRVPIVVAGETIGEVQCGPKHGGALSDRDVELVTTFARQAALAVRNVRLNAELADRLAQVRAQATALRRSQNLLVRAQAAERQRLERNLHDGIQQDLVALIAQVGQARATLDRRADVEGTLSDLQAGLRRVLTELRELAHGIHPSVLSDRGLLEAVEALAARAAVPVAVRADPALRGVRFDDQVEGAAYFTAAEALANVSKHASASEVELVLARTDGHLDLEVRDDGVGFEVTGSSGGLDNLAARVGAVGGQLQVVSQIGQGSTIRATLPANHTERFDG